MQFEMDRKGHSRKANSVLESVGHGYTQFRTDKVKSWKGIDGKPVDRSKFLMASEVYTCQRRIAYSKLIPGRELGNGLHDQLEKVAGEPDIQERRKGTKEIRAVLKDSVYGYLARGDSVENWVVEMIAASVYSGKNPYYTDFWYYGDRQVTLTYKGLGATLDGLLRKRNGHWLNLETKSITTLPVNITAPGYYAQTQLARFVANKNREELGLDGPVSSSVLVHFDPSNYFTASEHVLRYDPAVLKSVRKARRQIFNKDGSVKDPATVPAISDELKGKDCWTCPFRVECRDTQMQGTAVAAAAKNTTGIFK